MPGAAVGGPVAARARRALPLLVASLSWNPPSLSPLGLGSSESVAAATVSLLQQWKGRLGVVPTLARCVGKVAQGVRYLGHLRV